MYNRFVPALFAALALVCGCKPNPLIQKVASLEAKVAQQQAKLDDFAKKQHDWDVDTDGWRENVNKIIKEQDAVINKPKPKTGASCYVSGMESGSGGRTKVVRTCTDGKTTWTQDW